MSQEMKIHFKKQDYQEESVKKVIDLFKGQEKTFSQETFTLSNFHDRASFIVNFNQLTLGEEELLKNLKKVQVSSKLEVSSSLEKLSFIDKETKEEIIGKFPNYTIEMETGTGKTYVYLKTILELHKQFGFSKFIIVVPSVAIREGVKQSFNLMRSHFKGDYSFVENINLKIYDSNKKTSSSLFKDFSVSGSLEILLLNMASFNRDSNVINKEIEKGVSPIDYIQSVNPIVIMDEPQNMESDISKSAIMKLNPLYTLRYSATHRESYNCVYSLNPVEAYEKGLVKQIEVLSVISDTTLNGIFIQILELKSTKTKIEGTLLINKKERDVIKRTKVKVDTNSDLYKLSGNLEAYRGYEVTGIDVSLELVYFSNSEILRVDQRIGEEILLEEIQRSQIHETIKTHLEKELELKEKGIKVLSLFFIDKVENYRFYDSQGNPQKGKFSLIFEEELSFFLKQPKFQKLKSIYDKDLGDFHDGYFSQDKKGKMKDSSRGDSEDKNQAFELIMKDKIKLLKEETPLRFIFSHSALREGWDNPNVFQICTLNETKSEMKKRQEIGRGLRLCVNKEGVRVEDKGINILTVIANESYQEFAQAFQKEIEDDFGITLNKGKDKNLIQNREDRVQISLNKGSLENPYFMELFEKVKQKSKYIFKINSESLIENCVQKINEISLSMDMIKITKGKIQTLKEDFSKVDLSNGPHKRMKTSYSLMDFIQRIEKVTSLTRKTILEIFNRVENLDSIFFNPEGYVKESLFIIQKEIQDQMLKTLSYEKIENSFYDYESLFNTGATERYKDTLVEVKDLSKTLYNYVECDSSIEKNLVSNSDIDSNILFYTKLPRSFKIPTPLGNYNPDWALVKRDEKGNLNFILETKSTLNRDELRPSERYKIECGEKYFEKYKGIEYRQITKLFDLEKKI